MVVGRGASADAPNLRQQIITVLVVTLCVTCAFAQRTLPSASLCSAPPFKREAKNMAKLTKTET